MTARKANITNTIDFTPIIVGSWKSRFNAFNWNVSGTKRDVAPKQRYAVIGGY